MTVTTALALALALAAAGRAGDHFVVVFGAESQPPRPQYSHSWAAFVRLPCYAPCPGPPEVTVISWLPCKVMLTPNSLLPEPGHNFDLPDTFRIVLGQCERVTAWGPYRIEPELYCRATRQAVRLEAGAVRYKTVDWLYDPHDVSNCIHALTVFNEEKRLRVGRTNFGDVASYYITDSYRQWIVCPHEVYPWVAELLGLGQYPIRWRTLDQGRPRD
jgi:hypothetical protein